MSATIKINNTEFNMYSYFQTDTGVNVTLEDTTFGAIETAASNNATVEVGEEYVGLNLQLMSMTKTGDKIAATFISKDLAAAVSAMQSQVDSMNTTVLQNTDDIEANAEAITELAEIIGGAE